jgi:hypothetical protein
MSSIELLSCNYVPLCVQCVCEQRGTNERSVTSCADLDLRLFRSRCCETHQRDRVHGIASSRMLEPMDQLVHVAEVQ